ncbi:MAG: hypothetical protein J5965_26435 [Aeriscardovia sp.]|nr:hypothetical protein [Aeriscardovia sp.]
MNNELLELADAIKKRLASFENAQNGSFLPFLFFDGVFPSRFSRFSVAKLVNNLRFPSTLLKNRMIFNVFIYFRSILPEISYFCPRISKELW